MVRRLINILTLVCVALLAFITFRRPTATTARATATGNNWTSVTSRDLNIAAVFLTARDRDVGQALDSLQVLAARDAKLNGHVLAHALGRFTIAQHKNDLSVLAHCRPIFEAGCYHGVLEGFLATQKSLDRDTIASICSPVERSSPNRQPALECSHGLGHGLLERVGYDLTRALGACDYLRDADARGECHDGVFMENVIHGLGDSMISVGDDAMAAHNHMMQMEGPTAKREFFRKTDLAFPCDSVAAQYQSSCWSYQPLVVIQLSGADIQKTLHICDKASDASAVTCYRGFGKQSTAWFSNRAPEIVKTCESAAAAHVGDCLAGAVETYVDFAWTPDRALEFCRSVPTTRKSACYAEVGRRMAPIRADSAALDSDCRRAETEYVTACLKAAVAAHQHSRSANL
jgi:hypothetical protein